MPRRRDKQIPTRATLIQRLKDWQDQASWQDFFDTYWKLIYGVARKSGLSDVEAQDVVQETLAAVAKHMPSFKYNPAIGSFKAWLLKMTHWRITDQFRKRRLSRRLEPLSSDTTTGDGIVEEVADPSGESVYKLWDGEWEWALLDAAVTRVRRRIDPQKYQIFDFYVNKEWAAEKVARSFGVTVEQVYLVKHRVTETIKDEVKRLEKEMI